MCVADKTLVFAIYLYIFKSLRQKRPPIRNLKGEKKDQKTQKNSPKTNKQKQTNKKSQTKIAGGLFLLTYSSCSLRGCLAVLPSSFSQLRWPLN